MKMYRQIETGYMAAWCGERGENTLTGIFIILKTND